MVNFFDHFSNIRKLKSLLGVTSGAFAIFTGISLCQGNPKFYNDIAMPIIHLIDAETAHRIALIIAKFGLISGQKTSDFPTLNTTLWNLDFQNPVGMAAGFDKNAEAVKGLHKMGFGFVEVGSVTPNPQPGNSKPRLFRLMKDQAIINSYGFNNEGHKVVHSRLNELKKSYFHGIVGVNLGKNKHSLDPHQDYIEGVRIFSDVADYLVVNVSSPNTPRLRELQGKDQLKELLRKINILRAVIERKPPLLVKLAPDLSEQEQKDVAEILKQATSKVDGIIISNTTVNRLNLSDPLTNQQGGLSGAPISQMSTRMIANIYLLTNGELPIIGVGGIFDGKDAYEKIKAGASLIQIYTSFTYHGPPIIEKITEELSQLLEKDGYTALPEAVGKDAQKILLQTNKLE